MTAIYRFGRFALRAASRQLLVDEQPAPLGARAFDVLLALIERRDRLVTKNELLDLVWPGLVVEENNLQVQVSALRKIIGQDAIATIPGRGYRFAPALQLIAAQATDVVLARKHNLPEPLTSFVGHENDLAEYAQMLEQTRLLTLTGIGGCGKTRLAIELARMILPSFPDGAWFVDLAPVAEAERVASAAATTLYVREEVDKPIQETLARHLAGQRLLLVLDNCEHMLDACATFVERMLTAAPGVRALITSREGLGIAGERVVPVRSLALPPAASAQDLAAMANIEAVRLFVDRARHVASNFALNPTNALAIAEICHRLDGIPLALELAAARVKLLSVEQIRDRLDDRFRLLTGSARAIPRHQTLFAILQWSYDHLAVDEQQLLRGLSVFAGGWALGGAIAVAGYARDEFAVLEGLGRLVDQSLVLVERAARDEPRYRMLESVRQYAQDRLNELGEGETMRYRHLEFYVALAEAAERELVGSEQSEWYARLDQERENLLAAHSWCDHGEGGAELGLRLVFALRMYFRNRGLPALGHRVTMEALMRPGAQERNLARCRALWAAGEHLYFMGHYGEAREFAEMSLAIARERRDEGRVAEALRLLGNVVVALGYRALAREYLQEALALSRRLGDKRQLSSALTEFAELHRAEGDPDSAGPLYEEALALDRELGDRGAIAISLANLAMTSISLGLASRAREMVHEGLVIAEDIGSKRAGLGQLDCSAGLAAFLGEWERAARLHAASRALSEQMGYHGEPADEAFLAPLVAQTRDALGAAAFATAEISGRSLSYDEAIGEARAWLEQRS